MRGNVERASERAYLQSPQDLAVRLHEYADEIDQGLPARLTLGLPTADRLFNRMWGARLIVVLGRPSMGKTTVLNWMAAREVRAIRQRIADADASPSDWPEYVCYLSAEEDAEDVILTATGAGYGTQSVAAGRTSTDALRQTARDITAWPLWIASRRPTPLAETEMADVPLLSIERLWGEIAHVEHAYGKRPSALFVDYLQIIDTEKPTDKMADQVRAVVRGLNTMKKALGCPVVVASQAGRRVDDYATPIPEIGDSFGSAYAEHDADGVLAVWMPSGSPSVKHGGAITIDEQTYPVNDGLLIIQGLKQRKGKRRWREAAWIDHSTGRIGPITSNVESDALPPSFHAE